MKSSSCKYLEELKGFVISFYVCNNKSVINKLRYIKVCKKILIIVVLLLCGLLKLCNGENEK